MWSISLDAMPLALEVENTQLEIDTLDHFHRHGHCGLFSNQLLKKIASQAKLEDELLFLFAHVISASYRLHEYAASGSFDTWHEQKRRS